MSLPPRPPFPALIPESAPFTAEQRVWLDGLFAGLLSLEHGVTPLSREQAEALLPGGLDLSAPSGSTTNSSRARSMRRRACSRSTSQTSSLATIASYRPTISLPASTPESTRTPGPEGSR